MSACEPIIFSYLRNARYKHEWTSEGVLFQPREVDECTILPTEVNPLFCLIRWLGDSSALWLVRPPVNQTLRTVGFIFNRCLDRNKRVMILNESEEVSVNAAGSHASANAKVTNSSHVYAPGALLMTGFSRSVMFRALKCNSRSCQS